MMVAMVSTSKRVPSVQCVLRALYLLPACLLPISLPSSKSLSFSPFSSLILSLSLPHCQIAVLFFAVSGGAGAHRPIRRPQAHQRCVSLSLAAAVDDVVVVVVVAVVTALSFAFLPAGLLISISNHISSTVSLFSIGLPSTPASASTSTITTSTITDSSNKSRSTYALHFPSPIRHLSL